jgi:hypothetical protein
VGVRDHGFLSSDFLYCPFDYVLSEDLTPVPFLTADSMDFENRLFWTRQEIYITNIFLPIVIGFLVFCLGLLALFVLTFLRQHYRLWRLGKEEDRFDQVGKRLKKVLAVTFANSGIGKEAYPGAMHFLIFWEPSSSFWERSSGCSHFRWANESTPKPLSICVLCL